MGRAVLCETSRHLEEPPEYTIAPENIPSEKIRFHNARGKAVEELRETIQKLSNAISEDESAIFTGHIAMLEDRGFIREVERRIGESRENAEAAVTRVLRFYEKVLAGVEDELLAQRAADIREVARRVLGNLLFVHAGEPDAEGERVILVAREMTPGLTQKVERALLAGLLAERGGPTGHAAILARSLGIPAVSGLEKITTKIHGGERVIIDGHRGFVLIHPTAEQVAFYVDTADEAHRHAQEVLAEADLPAVTRDGHSVTLLANISEPADLENPWLKLTSGFGLVRTEFVFFSDKLPPSEEKQFAFYRDLLGHTRGPVNVRLLDVGADKHPAYLALPAEENPHLGYRGIRVLLDHYEMLLGPQLRALFRAGNEGDLGIILPLVTGVEEIHAMREAMGKAKGELASRGIRAGPARLGVMIEVPSAVAIIDEILEEADLVLVGTNDLMQYLLAADRVNARMARYYDAAHPAVVRLLAAIADAARRFGKDASLCGELASDPQFTVLLLGLGYSSFSMTPAAAPHVKDVVRLVTMETCRELAAKALKAHTAAEVRALLRGYCVGPRCFEDTGEKVHPR